jgi:hypothetical protein
MMLIKRIFIIFVNKNTAMKATYFLWMSIVLLLISCNHQKRMNPDVETIVVDTKKKGKF